MGFFSKFEGKMEDTFEGAVDRMAAAPISPVQIAKKAEKKGPTPPAYASMPIADRAAIQFDPSTASVPAGST